MLCLGAVCCSGSKCTFASLHCRKTSLCAVMVLAPCGQVVAQLLNHYLGQSGRHANIIVETSGDTGPAAIAGVRGCEYVRIFCLYPHQRVSDVQELQLITVDAPNVHVYRTEGDTDEQVPAARVAPPSSSTRSTGRLPPLPTASAATTRRACAQAEALKLLFGDRAFMEAYSVCSINSINWARIMVSRAVERRAPGSRVRPSETDWD